MSRQIKTLEILEIVLRGKWLKLSGRSCLIG